jgi:hypothetical protein
VTRPRSIVLGRGIKFVETFVDRGFSAYTGENSDKGDLKAILDLAAAGKIKPGTHLVVESLDRKSADRKSPLRCPYFLTLLISVLRSIE